jgi:folate-dependent phosphoribosylglycinamide formyltransferase PurN
MMLPALPTSDLGRPIRVVLFGGAFPGRAAPALMARLGTHPEIEVVGGIYEGPGLSWRTRIRETMRRRGAMAPVALALQIIQVLGPSVWSPVTAARLRREGAAVRARCIAVPDASAPEVLARVRAWDADLGVVDGSGQPGLALASLPRFGTLRTHYGTLPEYRGDKLTFWEVHNGEPTAGIAIQRLEAGIDTGDVLRRGSVPIARKGLPRVDRELHAVGVELYIQAILDVKRGQATPTPAGTAAGTPRYPHPGVLDALRMLARRPFGSRRS